MTHYRTVFPHERRIEFYAIEELDDDSCLVYTLYDDGTFERECVPTDSLVPPAALDGLPYAVPVAAD